MSAIHARPGTRFTDHDIILICRNTVEDLSGEELFEAVSIHSIASDGPSPNL